jgi:MtaA/CmuA family methyltransferase
MHFAARFSGRTYGEFASDHRVLVDCNLRAMEYFDTDMVGLISDPYRETSAFGARVSFPAEAVPVCAEPIVRTPEDVIALKNPDVYRCERTFDRIRGAELFRQHLHGAVPVIGWVEGPLAEACDLAGLDHMLLQLMLDPDFCDRLMDKCLKTAMDFSAAQIDAGCDIIGIGDAICSQIDLDTYRQFVFERHQELIAHIHACGARVKLHICGNITHLLPAIRLLGADIVDLDYPVDLDEAYEQLGPEVIRCGNLSPMLLEERTAGEVYAAVTGLLEREKGRRYILSAGCEVIVTTPPENLLAMRNASKHESLNK